ncbi:hypothetical protein BV898_13798 [Hypsibius exemplaris]|uniref:WD repeat-containing and planar cell polarity effector protein fritz-like protein n=1 Tax=Hypsibius exemplaris TaxID=2072580 RepID=A0A1W0W9S1_HYPEX|nr:hypothetical protein BV898_13798 [Hypsibius exemplaris]
MSVHLPVLGHLRLFSLLADMRDDLPSCSKYNLPGGKTVSVAPVNAGNSSAGLSNNNDQSDNDSFGFRKTVPETVNLSQFEALLRTSALVDWRWDQPERTSNGSLQILLQCGILVTVSFNACGVDISYIHVNHTLTSHVRKKQLVSCAISKAIVVTAFAGTDLISLRLNTGAKNKNSICKYRRRSKRADEFDSQLDFNDTGKLLIFSFAPKVSAVKKWLPTRPPPTNWTLEVYACDPENDVPLQRLHKLENHQTNSVLLRSTFLAPEPNVFLIATKSSSDELQTSVRVYRHSIEQHCLRVISDAGVGCFESNVLSCAVHVENGDLLLGLDDNFIVIYSDRWKELRRSPCDVRPQHVQWGPDRALIIAGSFEASFQVFDGALQLLNSSLLNDTNNPCDGLRLRSCMNSVSALLKLEWITMSPTDGDQPHFASAILLHFERGPLGMLCFGAGNHRTTFATVLHYWLNEAKFVQAVKFLTALGHDLSVAEVTAAATAVMTSVLKHDKKEPCEICDILEMLLNWLSGSHPTRDAPEIKQLQTCYSVLLRRFFGFLVRFRIFDRAQKLAEICQDPSLFKVLENAASVLPARDPPTDESRTMRTIMESVAEAHPKEPADRPASQISDGAVPTTPISWTDLGEI